MLLDCHLSHPASYAFFVFAYYRKVLFALSLLHYIPGVIQGVFEIELRVIDGATFDTICEIIGLWG